VCYNGDLSGRVRGWISEPSGRGTASLLYNCLITIFLCVWSATHSNIPERNKSELLVQGEVGSVGNLFLVAIDSYFFIREALDELPVSFSEARNDLFALLFVL
jgi:hypothetical protein